MQSTKLFLRGSASMLAMAMATPFLANPAQANPSGGAVTSGSASIANPLSNATQVQQTSEGVVIDWSSFNVGNGQTTTFVQPNAQAIAVNRIGGNSATQIFGTLDANGRIVLINGNGLLFGKGSQVNVGSLVATSSNASDADILSGKANFAKSANPNAQVVNQGAINASTGGFVALVAPSVTNTGTVQAKLGNVTLGGASNFTIDFSGDGLVSFAAPVSGQGRVANSGQISGATVTLDARSAESAAVGVVNAGGTIVAQGARLQGGSIVLDGGAGGSIDVSGSLNASGTNGGGTIAVGYSGNALAGNVTLKKNSVVAADATQSGNGGSVMINSQTKTNFDGLISARGAGATGAGGNVEVSTKGVLQFTGFADTSAESGKSGSLLLDPTDLYINTTGTAPEAGASAISVATLESELAAGNVTLQTATPGTQHGDITVADGVSWSSGYSLLLNASRNIVFDNHVEVSNLGDGGLSLRADDAGRGIGTVKFDGNSSVAADGGAVSIFYNPTNYNTPFNYSGHVNLSGGGTLTAYMLVNNATDLQLLGENATTLAGDYALGRAINLSAYNGGGGFPVIGGIVQLPFTGIFDGLGLAISHLQINNAGNNIGLFYEIGAGGLVSDLLLSDVSVTGANDTGALAGENFGTIDNVTISGTVSGTNYVGGVVGQNAGDIVFSSARGTASGTNYVGGLAGYDSGSVEFGSSADTVTGSDDLGGLVGEIDGGSVSESSATGQVSGSADLGGLVGFAASNASITGSDARGAVSGVNYVGGLVGDDNDSIVGTSYATGNVISTAADNSYAGGLVGAYTLVSASSGGITASHATGSVTGGGYYEGGLVGYNEANIVSSYAKGNVTASGTGTPYDIGGLVGYNNGFIDSSYATGTVTGSNSVGGLVGYNSFLSATADGEIEDSHASGSVKGDSLVLDSSMGGLVGLNLGPEILNSFATGSVSQIDGELQGGIGGLIGFNSGGLVQNSYATGAVAAASAPDVGGLIGYNDDGTISGSHSTGVVTGGDQDVGGLVGASIGGSSEIETSYSTSSVTASLGTQVGQESTDVGGLVGENQGMIQRSYATGSATGNDVVGGLVGVNDIGAIIKLSYASGAATATANPAVVGDGTDAGGLVGSASGTLSYDYALGNVSGYDDVGGLIGSAASGLTVKQAYSTGVSSASNPSPIALGASIGLNNGATLTDVYWDSTNNPTLAGVGSGANGTSSLTTAQLTSGLPTGFTASIWGSSPSVNDGLPYLLALPPA